jgi:hypothetical protein
MNLKDTLCAENVEFLIAKAGGIYGKHGALKCCIKR